VVVELECGITVYPPLPEPEERGKKRPPRWRAVWQENGERLQCEAASEETLAARLEKVAERLTADAPNMLRSGADLIAWYLSPDRHQPARRWSAKHADTQRRLCERFVAPVLAAAATRAQSIAVEHARTRTAFGKPLAQHEGVSFMLADNEIALQQCRLSIWHTAWAWTGVQRADTRARSRRPSCRRSSSR
jgi:hypothetical protein